MVVVPIEPCVLNKQCTFIPREEVTGAGGFSVLTVLKLLLLQNGVRSVFTVYATWWLSDQE